jgi:hypothetical protein
LYCSGITRNSPAARRQTTAASGDRKKEEAETKVRERGKRAAMTMKQSRFKRICVFCGSSQGKKASYHDAAVELGNQLVTISRLVPVCHLLCHPCVFHNFKELLIYYIHHASLLS